MAPSLGRCAPSRSHCSFSRRPHGPLQQGKSLRKSGESREVEKSDKGANHRIEGSADPARYSEPERAQHGRHPRHEKRGRHRPARARWSSASRTTWNASPWKPRRRCYDKRKFEAESSEKLVSKGAAAARMTPAPPRTNLKTAEIQLQQAKVALEKKTVHAPFDGVVTHCIRSRRRGEPINTTCRC